MPLSHPTSNLQMVSGRLVFPGQARSADRTILDRSGACGAAAAGGNEVAAFGAAAARLARSAVQWVRIDSGKPQASLGTVVATAPRRAGQA